MQILYLSPKKKMILLDKKIVMDTDVLSNFTSIGKLDDLINLFPNRIIIPNIVLDELEYLKYSPKLKYIYEEVFKNIENNKLELFDIKTGSKEFEEFLYLTSLETKKLGDGEAACLAIALSNDRIISSSNLRDIGFFADNKLVENIPTIDILKGFYNSLNYSIEDVDKMKDLMIQKGSRLPAQSIKDL